MPVLVVSGSRMPSDPLPSVRSTTHVVKKCFSQWKDSILLTNAWVSASKQTPAL